MTLRLPNGPRRERTKFGSIGLWIALALGPLCLKFWLLWLPPPTYSTSSRRVAPFSLPIPTLHDKKHDIVARKDQKLHEPQSPPVADDTITVGVAVTITGCSPRFPMDGAAVLQHSFLTSHGGSPTTAKSRYRFQFYAIYHPNATECVQPLGDLGYVLMERDTPVALSEIRNPSYRDVLPRSGCCGEKELLKLEAFLLPTKIAVLVDMDVLILKPLDHLFDLILFNLHPDRREDESRNRTSRHLMWPQRAIPDDVWFLFVNDYAMVWAEEKKPTQGGFAVLKPNRTIYTEIVDIVREGDFDPDRGWRNQSGVFWGSTTFQGLMPYYFQYYRPGHAVELHWCTHDNMNSPNGKERNGVWQCYSGQPVDACDDCTAWEVEDVWSAHFTVCGKPFECYNMAGDDNYRLCHELQRSWFRARSDMERSWGRSGRGTATGADLQAQFFGYCSRHQFMGYQPIELPYGPSRGGASSDAAEIPATVA